MATDKVEGRRSEEDRRCVVVTKYHSKCVGALGSPRNVIPRGVEETILSNEAITKGEEITLIGMHVEPGGNNGGVS